MAWCPGCDGAHGVPSVKVGKVEPWALAVDDKGRPSLSPSILIRTTRPGIAELGEDPAKDIRVVLCHSILEAGVWKFQSDCPHALANRAVEVPAWPLWQQPAAGEIPPAAGP